MKELTETLAMHGYAVYVWPSFIVAALVMSVMVAVSLHSLRKAQKTLRELQKTTHNEA